METPAQRVQRELKTTRTIKARRAQRAMMERQVHEMIQVKQDHKPLALSSTESEKHDH